MAAVKPRAASGEHGVATGQNLDIGLPIAGPRGRRIGPDPRSVISKSEGRMASREAPRFCSFRTPGQTRLGQSSGATGGEPR